MARQEAEQDWRSQSVITVEEAAPVLGLSRSSAYGAAKRGEIPTLKLGRRLLVPVAQLRRLLGELENDNAPGTNRGEVTTEDDGAVPTSP